ncbi:probable G-protein coupled receptor Mth-like 3 [Centruroides sculpturatus]|uniref:probable G-protein coupled receptor Mth-like 3 n=1 Tax=Centruroides sculpturatus TaxID=218467 RepID=UPI000C6E1981|nr:probable G-protein coupled receptor Mth-like 3 [Centruroides sculpturatus]
MMNTTIGNDLSEAENFTNMTSTDTKKSSVANFHSIIIVCLALSMICLLIIGVVYSIITDFRNIHGKILLSLSGNLGVTYTFLILDLMFRRKFSPIACLSIGFVIHITFLATFFWTNIMAYDAWRTITRMKPKKIRTNKKRYLCYAAYAWGATLLISLPAVIFDNTDFIPVKYRPNMGVKRCWLSGTPAFLIYFNSPVGLVLFTNLIFFLMTIKTLIQLRNTTMILHVNKDKQRFYLYIKLFLIMGLIWITEYIPWLSGIYKLYAIAGILNSLHGVYLFVIFICKRSVFRSLRDLYKGTKVDNSKSRKISQPTLGTSVKGSSNSVFYCSSSSENTEKVRITS